MKTQLSGDQLSRYVDLRINNPAAADRYWERCVGQDAAMDDEAGFFIHRISRLGGE